MNNNDNKDEYTARFAISRSLLPISYTQCTVKLRPNFEKIAQLKCTTNEKRNLSEHDEKNFKWKIFW